MKREHPKDTIARLQAEVERLKARIRELEGNEPEVTEHTYSPQGWRARAHERSEE